MAHPGIVSLKKTATLLALGALGAGNPSFEPEYNAILNYATGQGFTLPSAANQITQNALLSNMKVAGIWAELDIFYNFYTDGDANFAKINWKKPGFFQAVGTGHEPTFFPLLGFKGNGVDQYLDTTWKAGIDGVNYVWRNSSIFMCVETAEVNDAIDFSTYDGTYYSTLQAAHSANLAVAYIDGSTIMTAPVGAGLWMANSLVANIGFFYNGASVVAGVSGTAGVSITTTYLLAQTPTTLLSVRTMSMAGAASSLTGKEAILSQSWDDYKKGTLAEIAYQKVLDYAILNGYVLPSDQQQIDQKKLVSDLITSGAWDELDVFYNFLTDGDENFAKINWKTPGVANATEFGTVTFTVNDGFAGDGLIGSYLNTNFIAGVGSKIQQGNSGAIAEVDFFTDGQTAFGLGAGGNTSIILIPSASDATLMAISSGNYSSRPFPVFKRGFFHGQVNAPDQQRINIDGNLGSFSTQPVGLDTVNPVYIFAVNNGPSHFGPSNGTVRCYGLGSKMLGKEVALYNAWKTYRDLYYVVPHPYDKVITFATESGYGLPSAAQQVFQKQFVDDLISAGIWDELDIFYNLFTDGSPDFAKINWKSPGTHQLVNSGTVAFVPNSGFNLSPGSFNTGYRPGEVGSKFSSSASFGFVCQDWSFAAGYMWGGYDSVIGRWAGLQRANQYFTINAGGLNVASGMLASHIDGGLVMVQMPDGYYSNFWVDGVLVNQAPIPSPKFGVYTTDWYIGGTHAVAITDVTVTGVQLYFAGSSLAGKEAAFYNAWIKYRTTVRAKAYYKAIIDFATLQGYALPSVTNQEEQYQLVYDMVKAGAFDALDCFYCFLTDVATPDFATINWINPALHQGIISGSVIYTPNVGVKAADATGKISLVVPSATTKMTIGDAVFLYDFITSNGQNFAGCDSGTNTGITSNTSLGGCLNGPVSGIAPIVAANVNALAGYLYNPFTGGRLVTYINGAQTNNINYVPVGKDPLPLRIFGINGTATNDTFSTYKCLLLGSTNWAFTNFGWEKYKATLESKVAYKAIIDYAVLQGYALPSGPQQTLQKKLIYDLMVAGVWNQLDIFYNFHSDAGADFAKINWKNPAAYYIVGAAIPFTTNNGFKGDGVSQHFDTQWVPGVGPNYKLTDASMFADIPQAGTPPNNYVEFGAADAFSSFFQMEDTAVRTIGLMNSGGASPAFITYSPPSTSGFMQMSIFGAANTIHRDGLLKVSSAVGTPGLPSTVKTFIFATSYYGGLFGFSAATISCFGAGAALQGKEAALFNVWTSYKSAIASMSVDLTMLVGTNGLDKGYLNGVYGGVSVHMIGNERLTAFYSKPDNTVHIAFEGAAQIEGVDRIMIQLPGVEAELLWTGTDYEGVSVPVVNALSIVNATVNFTLAT